MSVEEGHARARKEVSFEWYHSPARATALLPTLLVTSTSATRTAALRPRPRPDTFGLPAGRPGTPAAVFHPRPAVDTAGYGSVGAGRLGLAGAGLRGAVRERRDAGGSGGPAVVSRGRGLPSRRGRGELTGGRGTSGGGGWGCGSRSGGWEGSPGRRRCSCATTATISISRGCGEGSEELRRVRRVRRVRRERRVVRRSSFASPRGASHSRCPHTPTKISTTFTVKQITQET